MVVIKDSSSRLIKRGNSMRKDKIDVNVYYDDTETPVKLDRAIGYQDHTDKEVGYVDILFETGYFIWREIYLMKYAAHEFNKIIITGDNFTKEIIGRQKQDMKHGWDRVCEDTWKCSACGFRWRLAVGIPWKYEDDRCPECSVLIEYTNLKVGGKR